ncbi:hypothetical protein MOQ_002938 [Trypanosoma cruzi marinkellei]|uniref:Uncharacterized protein n=1 Tax=Trypanosoma cruzi marinkellei TaxID=85056 RepID=K2MDE1_TRYCR|nr:hypothetical protein MOQ_002938 [Trypanosoma cruzi marinkellei]
MSENLSSRRFLMETCSQQLHKEENMRRRLELIRRESTKPPVMHFGTTGSLGRSNSKSVSPPPHVVLTSKEIVKESSRSAPMVNSASRSRPQSRERSRRLPLPPGAKPMRRKPSLPRSKSYRGVSASKSRVASPVPALQAVEGHPAQPLRKRTRSTSQTGGRAKLARVSQPRKNEANMEERRAPFMCSGSPSRGVASPLKRSASRTPPPLPLPTMKFDSNANTVDFIAPNTQLQRAQEAVLSASPLALPQTVNHNSEELKNALPVAEEEEEPIPFRVSEFRMPRTPQRRFSGVMNQVIFTPTDFPRFSHSAEEEQELKEKGNETGKDGDPADARESSARSEVIFSTSFGAAMPSSYRSPEKETVSRTPSVTVGDANEQEDEEEEVKMKEDEKVTKEQPSEVATTTAATCTATTAEVVTQEESAPPLSSVAFPLVALDVAVAVEPEPVAFPTYSSHAYECSSTTTEASEKMEEMGEARKLSFDWHDASQNEEKREVCLEKLTAEEFVPPVPQPQLESDALSQAFYECISAPSTPGLELPEAYWLLEATRKEMAVSSIVQRLPRRLGDRRNEEGRSSLVLVTGELPVVHTPRIQEPHTPPPSEKPKRYSPLPKPQFQVPDSHGSATSPHTNNTALLSCDLSPLPRPVTLRSQVGTPIPSSQKKVSVYFSQTPREEHGKTSPCISPAGTSKFNEEHTENGTRGETEYPVDEHAVETTPRCPPARCRSRSTGSRKSVVERLMECCSPDARKELENIIATEGVAQTPPLNRGSGQFSESLTETSSISQRVAARPRKHYYDYTYWERYLRDVTRQSAKKQRRKDAKKANKAARRSVAHGASVMAVSEAAVEREYVHPLAETNEDANSAVTSVVGRKKEVAQKNNSGRSSKSHSSRNKKTSSTRAPLRKTMSRKNRENILRRKRRLSGRQNRRK